MSVLRRNAPRLATIHDRRLLCLICETAEFWVRKVRLNTTAMDFVNQAALGLICANCGYVHEFVGGAVSLWDRDGGYPDDVEV